MDINNKIKIILKEADLYHTQGLLTEAESKYREILKIFHGNPDLNNADKIKKAIEKKIRDLDNEKKRVEKKVMSPEMNQESQDLITQMFVDADGEESPAAKLEGAKALIKFGQFDRAVEELKQLTKEESVKSDAAKQLMTCYVLSLRTDDAVEEIKTWIASEFLSTEQMENLLKHTKELFRNRGIDKTLPDISKKAEAESPVHIGKKKPISKIASETNLSFKKDSFFFEEDFEEYDVLASVKKTDKDGKKSKK